LSGPAPGGRAEGPDPDGSARTAATDLARRLADHWISAPDLDLLAVYLIGSLAHGGFSRRYSDIDLALVARAGLSTAALDRLHGDGLALSPEWGPRISVFWANRDFSVGRFPPLDRVDFLDNGVPLIERERVRPPRPALTEIRDYLGSAPFARWAERARAFAADTALAPQDRKAYLRTLLYPARLCFSWTTGRMGGNDEAVAFLQQQRPAGLDVDLVARALDCRRASADPDALFAARGVLPRQIEACEAVIAGGAPAA
jgi:predicted nucleotidyltransferase